MQYILCPRCKFKVPLTRHMCTTCGFVLTVPAGQRAVNDQLGANPKVQKGGFWQKFFGLEAPSDDHKEPGQEEPALS